MPPWLEDVQHLCVVLESLAGQVPRALEAGVPAETLLRALEPLSQRLARVLVAVSEEWMARSYEVALAAEMAAWGER